MRHAFYSFSIAIILIGLSFSHEPLPSLEGIDTSSFLTRDEEESKHLMRLIRFCILSSDRTDIPFLVDPLIPTGSGRAGLATANPARPEGLGVI
jgi:hypothetical protein